MKWVLPNDNTAPVITAQKHIHSGHGNTNTSTLPETCVIFEIGMAMDFVEANFETITLSEKLPCFLTKPKCLSIKDSPHVCFTKGGYGAPAAVDTLETIRALGVKRVVVVGMCGGFSSDIRVGDVVIPERILCEEGTSHHYFEEMAFAAPDRALWERAKDSFSSKFAVTTEATVTSDAFYRQTFAKEARWREQGCVGVDMEASALLAVSQYYGMPAVTLLICSDKHPISENSVDWDWGDTNFQEIRKSFVRQAVTFAAQL